MRFKLVHGLAALGLAGVLGFGGASLAAAQDTTSTTTVQDESDDHGARQQSVGSHHTAGQLVGYAGAVGPEQLQLPEHGWIVRLEQQQLGRFDLELPPCGEWLPLALSVPSSSADARAGVCQRC